MEVKGKGRMETFLYSGSHSVLDDDQGLMSFLSLVGRSQPLPTKPRRTS